MPLEGTKSVVLSADSGRGPTPYFLIKAKWPQKLWRIVGHIKAGKGQNFPSTHWNSPRVAQLNKGGRADEAGRPGELGKKYNKNYSTECIIMFMSKMNNSMKGPWPSPRSLAQPAVRIGPRCISCPQAEVFVPRSFSSSDSKGYSCSQEIHCHLNWLRARYEREINATMGSASPTSWESKPP